MACELILIPKLKYEQLMNDIHPTKDKKIENQPMTEEENISKIEKNEKRE